MVVLYDKIVYIEKVEREFIYTEPFLRCWKAIGLGDDEQHELEDILLENPRKGVVIEGLAGIRKLRIRLEGRGKSGGRRVIYILTCWRKGDSICCLLIRKMCRRI